MEEDDKKRDNLERAKIIMGKIDPTLLSAALSEMMMEADEAEEADVARAKKAIKGIYDSIPEGKDKTSIVSKAIAELDSDIIEKEVKVIKENLASIDKETIMEAAKDYLDIQVQKCKISLCECSLKSVCLCSLKSVCLCSLKSLCFISICFKCVNPLCVGRSILCPDHCLYPIQYQEELERDPLAKEQFKEEIIQEILQRPELSRAMKKMLKKIQDEK
jgi:hypothetical protein